MCESTTTLLIMDQFDAFLRWLLPVKRPNDVIIIIGTLVIQRLLKQVTDNTTHTLKQSAGPCQPELCPAGAL